MIAVGEALDRGDLLPRRGASLDLAGPSGDTVDQNGARSALAFSTPVLRAGEVEFISQNKEQRALCAGVYMPALAVDYDVHASILVLLRRNYREPRK